MKYKLFDYQQNIRNQMDDFFNHGGQRLLVQAPTGSGKSVVMCDWIETIRDSGKPIYFVTSSRALLKQFSDHLTEIEIPHGIIASGCPTLRYRVQVISAQSLTTRAHLIQEPYACLFEEAHHSTSNTFKKILDIWPKCKIVGMTATPERPDGTPLGDIYEDMILSPQVRWFIDNGFLSDYEYYVPQDFNTDGIHRTMGDFNSKELAERIQQDKGRVGSLIENYQKYANNKIGIAFATSIADSEDIANRFINNGYDMKALHSKMSYDLQDILNKCRTGDQRLISSCDLIGEGVDVKGLEVMLDARPTQSLVVQMQHWGRVLRVKYADGYDLTTKDGRLSAIQASSKQKAIILDFASNYTRFGLPDDPREWSLQGKSHKTKEKPTLKRCPSCQRPIPVVASVCPYCNYVFTREVAPREIKEREGELINIKTMSNSTPADNQTLIRMIARHAKNLKQAQKIAQDAGYKPQTAYIIWRKILKNTGW